MLRVTNSVGRHKMELLELIKVTKALLMTKMPKALSDIDVSTIRYYDRMGLLKKAERKGRNNHYSTEHLLQLIMIRLFQSEGYSLSQIKYELTHRSAKELSKTLCINEDVIRLAASNVLRKEKELLEQERETEMEATKQDVWSKATTNATKNCQVEVTDYQSMSAVKDSVLVGSVFAFIKTDNKELAETVHKCLYGQKSDGESRRASIFVSNTITLPGAVVKSNIERSVVGAVVADKDIYQEGEVSKIFVFFPEAKGENVNVLVKLQAVHIDQNNIKLDDNGCGFFRVPVMAAGRYDIVVSNAKGSIDCNFETTRYELAPFVVSATCGKTEKAFQTKINVEKYGVPYVGEATVSICENGIVKIKKDVSFKKGVASVEWDLTLIPDGQLSVLVADKEDQKLVSATPLTGSQKAEREDTEISHLGTVTSMSMIPSGGSIFSRGLYFHGSKKNNCPVVLKSCVANKVELKFEEDAKEVCIVIYDPIRKTHKSNDIAFVKAGSTQTFEFSSEFAVVHIGCFLRDEPWEGHALVSKPCNQEIKIKVDPSVEPGSKLKVQISSKKTASVLLKICDKRVRSIYNPLSKIASSLKRHFNLFNSLRVGRAVHPALQDRYGHIHGLSGYSGVSGFSGFSGMAFSGMAGPNVPRGMDEARIMRGASIVARSSKSAKYTSSYLAKPQSLETFGWSSDPYGNSSVKTFLSSPQNNDVVAQAFADGQNSAFSMLADAMAEPTRHSLEYNGVVSRQTLDKTDGLSYEAEIELKQSESLANNPSISTRKAVQDNLYCEFITVDKERTIEIKLPDVIGVFDIKAFFVSDQYNWGETSSEVRVEKALYIEPLIPKIAHQDDEVQCRAVIIGADETVKTELIVNGADLTKFDKTWVGKNLHLRWMAVPGSHEVRVTCKGNSDSVMRVVESPSEETVFTQEIRIVKPKHAYSVFDEDAISMKILPSMQEELNRVVSTTISYQHSCCEQTSACITAAAAAIIFGDDVSKSAGYQSLIAGDRRLREMFNGKAFCYYPGQAVNGWANRMAATRLKRIAPMLSEVSLPEDVASCVKNIASMSEVAVKYEVNEHENTGYYRLADTPMQAAYFSGKENNIEKEAEKLLQEKQGFSFEEAAYAVAIMAKSGVCSELLIDLANKTAKTLKGCSGWIGTTVLMAYMSMVYELTKAKIISGDNKAKLLVDNVEMTLEKAIKKTNISEVEAIDSPIMLRVNRLVKVSYEDRKGEVPMTVELTGEHGDTFKAGDVVKLKVSLEEYKTGDVLLVLLPDCLSRIVGGGQSKKFEIDLMGKKEAEVELVAHEKTDRSQRWAAIVRNMYDSDRIGSVGLMTVNVE